MNPALEEGPVNVENALLRHADDIDLTKASQSCRRCHGVGITGHLLKEEKRVPIICRCVIRNGGVKERQASITNLRGTSGSSMTADEIVNTALRLPHSMLPMCIKSLDKLASSIPAGQENSERALVVKNARRVLLQRFASVTATAEESVPMTAPKEIT